MKTVDSLSYSYSCCSILSYHVTLSVAIPLSRGRGCSCNGGCAGLYRAVLYFNSNQIKSNCNPGDSGGDGDGRRDL